MTDRILIIDFGSQVTQLIARRVRESGVYSPKLCRSKALKKRWKILTRKGLFYQAVPPV